MTEISTPRVGGSVNDKRFEDAAKRPFNLDGGKDEASITECSNDRGLNDEYRSSQAVQDTASQVDPDGS